MVEHMMDVQGWLREQLEQASPDLLRAMVKDFAEALMGAEAEALCGAPYGERSPERVNRRNGYRERDWDTRVGSIELAVPKLRAGSYFPDWLLCPRRRAEQAFVSVIADAYLAGVSTRRVEKLVGSSGSSGCRKARSRAWRARSTSSSSSSAPGHSRRGPTPTWCSTRSSRGAAKAAAPWAPASCTRWPWAAMATASRSGSTSSPPRRGRPGRVAALASRPRPSGRRPGHLGCPPRARRRDREHPSGGELAALPYPFRAHLLTRVPKSAQPAVATLVRSIFAQPDPGSVHEQHAG